MGDSTWGPGARQAHIRHNLPQNRGKRHDRMALALKSGATLSLGRRWTNWTDRTIHGMWSEVERMRDTDTWTNESEPRLAQSRWWWWPVAGNRTALTAKDMIREVAYAKIRRALGARNVLLVRLAPIAGRLECSSSDQQPIDHTRGRGCPSRGQGNLRGGQIIGLHVQYAIRRTAW